MKYKKSRVFIVDIHFLNSWMFNNLILLYNIIVIYIMTYNEINMKLYNVQLALKAQSTRFKKTTVIPDKKMKRVDSGVS